MNPAGITRSADRLRTGVALCTYNGAAYVHEQIASILRQTHQVDRIVVSDDGSRDDTLARAAEALEGCGADWTLMPEGRLGITQNFARAVAACGTDIVFLCDQDDVWLPHKVQTVLGVFERDPQALLVFSDARLVDGQLQDLGRSQFEMVRMNQQLFTALEGPQSFETLLRRNVVTGATVAFRRTLLDDALPFVDGWLHDEWLAIIAAARGGLRGVPEPLVLYRQHGRNQCGMRPESLGEQLAGAARTSGPATGSRRLGTLTERLQARALGGASSRLAWVEDAQRFALWRSSLPAARWERALPIAAKLAAGHYARHADGLRSAAKDILAAS